MKTLHVYLTRQVLAMLLMTVAVFTFVMLLGNVLKEILALLVSGKITGLLVLKAIALLIPYVMAYVLPFGMLTAVVLVFGRFSADQELTASRASGISLISLITPVILLSLALSILCALFNLWIAPQCRGAYRDLIMQLGVRNTSTLITEDRFIDEIPGVVFYVRKKNGNDLEDVRLYLLENGEIKSRAAAEKGKIVWDRSGRWISFQLKNAISETKREEEPPVTYEEGFVGPIPPPKEPESEWIPGRGDLETEPIDLTKLMTKERKLRLGDMNFHELRNEIVRRRNQGIAPMPAIVQLNRNISFSFACFAFVLVGIPLALKAHRRETSIGVAIALGLVLVYYSFFIMGDALEAKEKWRPDLIVWLPNLAFQVIGAALLARANRRG